MPALANVIGDLIPAAFHHTGQHENNQYESNRCVAGHDRMRPMRDLLTDRTASFVILGHYELGVNIGPVFQLASAFDEIRHAI